ncbi:hypothetical protein Tco_0959449, partial [Tanacetum coccineum]
MAQRVIPAAQLVPHNKQIGRCNNYAVLQSIPCSPECKIVGQILLDHSLSYPLIATADVLAVYLQQFWRTVSKVPDTEDTIKFLLDTEKFIYNVDMFWDTLKLLVETPENSFVAPTNIHTIEAFMNRVGYQGVVDKVSAFFTKNLAQPWQTMFKVFNRCLTTRTSGHDHTKINILQLFNVVINQTHVDYPALLWIEEDYHSVKDDIPLVSVYTTRNVLVPGMLILNAFLTAEVRETDDFKEYETVFIKVAVLMNQPQPVVSTQGMNRNTPIAHRSPTVSANPVDMKKRKQTAGESSSPRRIIKKKKQPLPSIPPPGDDRERDAIAEATLLSLTFHKTALLAEAQENTAKVQEKLDEEEIDKMVEGNTDEESYASEFANSILNNNGADVDDTRKKETEEDGTEHNILENEVENEPNVEAEKTDEIVKEKEVVSVSGSQEIRNEQKQTPIL